MSWSTIACQRQMDVFCTFIRPVTTNIGALYWKKLTQSESTISSHKRDSEQKLVSETGFISVILDCTDLMKL